jgi:hypothetical protein
LCETLLILRRTERYIVTFTVPAVLVTFTVPAVLVTFTVPDVLVTFTVPDVLVRFQRNLDFLERFSRNTLISNLIKIRPVGTRSMQTDGHTGTQTDRHDGDNGRLSQFPGRA